MSASPFSTPSPFPPPATKAHWGGDERDYLQCLLHELGASGNQSETSAAAMVSYLLPRLATPRGVERYQTAREYCATHSQEDLSYRDWLERVVAGFERYHHRIEGATESQPDGQPSVHSLIGQYVDRNCLKILHRIPDSERRADLIADVYLSLSQNFYYDTQLEPWLWTAARHHVLLELRQYQRESGTVALDAEPFEFDLSSDWHFTESSGVRQSLLEAIRAVDNQRYRVILLLIFLYDLDNTQLAAFFGVPVSRLTTWLSRARSAVRQRYNESNGPHNDYSSKP